MPACKRRFEYVTAFGAHVSCSNILPRLGRAFCRRGMEGGAERREAVRSARPLTAARARAPGCQARGRRGRSLGKVVAGFEVREVGDGFEGRWGEGPVPWPVRTPPSHTCLLLSITCLSLWARTPDHRSVRCEDPSGGRRCSFPRGGSWGARGARQPEPLQGTPHALERDL